MNGKIAAMNDTVAQPSKLTTAGMTRPCTACTIGPVSVSSGATPIHDGTNKLPVVVNPCDHAAPSMIVIATVAVFYVFAACSPSAPSDDAGLDASQDVTDSSTPGAD